VKELDWEIESIDDGILARILVPDGSTNVLVNSIIAIIVEDSEKDVNLDEFIKQKQFSPNELGIIGAMGPGFSSESLLFSTT
jgi:pyruvate/2-oxoglutarate dehydrogenase complex dihydrolipoamide acyltransferase (E2) component